MTEGEKLHAATTTADTAYHACYADFSTGRAALRSMTMRRSLCGIMVRPNQQSWDDERQARQDSCHRCVKRVKLLLDQAERQRALRGPLVAGYIRASTDKQVESPDVQEAVIRRYCERSGLPGPTLYVDKATGGGTPILEREAGGRMLRDLHRGDHMVITRVDRMMRSFLDFAATVEACSKRGITLHFIDFPMGAIKPDDDLAKCFLYLMAVFAAYERKLIVSRTVEALEWRREKGRRTTCHPPFGFRWEKNKDGHEYEVVDDFEASICEKALDLRMQGHTHQQILSYIHDEWGLRNPRSRDGKARFLHQQVGRLISRGIKIRRIRGIPLPEGIDDMKEMMRS